MKRILTFLSLFILFLMALTGCGEEAEDRKALVGMIIRNEEEQIPPPEGQGLAGWYLLGRQFFQGEAVQIWAVRNAAGGVDISMYRKDGSREELLSGAPLEYSCPWYLDSEGNRFLFLQGRNSAVIRLDDEGGEIYRRQGDAVEDICQLPDGRLLVIQQDEERNPRLAELDPDTGITEDIKAVELTRSIFQFIGAGEDGLLLLDNEGVWKVNMRDGGRECLLAFGGSYSPGKNVKDFRMLEDGKLEVLQDGGQLQKLELYDPVEDREVILVRKAQFNSDMEQYAFWFNQMSEDYYVYLDACPEGMDEQDFADRTLVELGTGKGPDIICAPLLEPWDLIEHGYFEDLTPWMESTGIREEDYFPAAFAYPRVEETEGANAGIYGVNMSVTALNFYIDREFLGEETDPDIEWLVKALCDDESNGVFEGWSAELILDYFLKGSENLWGMLDWETGSCDFGGELFAGMLEAAKRCADDGKGTRPVLLRSGRTANYYDYDYDQQQREEEGMTEINFFFDDGRNVMNSHMIWMAISSSSPNKEGAWEFLHFLLSGQVQMQVQELMVSRYPVNRKCFDEIAQLAVAEGAFVRMKDETVASPGWVTKGSYGNLYSVLGQEAYKEIFDPTEERVGIVREILEQVRPLPLKTAPILEIIYEEAKEYFYGTKSIDEVTAVIQNRVQLYLDEHR